MKATSKLHDIFQQPSEIKETFEDEEDTLKLFLEPDTETMDPLDSKVLITNFYFIF
jgi:hypothetical protein